MSIIMDNVYMSNPWIFNALQQFTDTEKAEMLAIVNETKDQKFVRRFHIVDVEGVIPTKWQFLGQDAENLHGDRIKWADANVSSWEDYIEDNYTDQIPPWLHKYISFDDIMEDLQKNDEIMILEWNQDALEWDWAVRDDKTGYNIENIKIISCYQ